MKTAIISDIHGNDPALEAVLADAVQQGVDRYIFAGDYIFDMPFSNEVVRRLMALEHAHIIAGNKEIYLRTLAQEDQRQWTHRQMGAAYQTFRELSPDVLGFLAGLPEKLYIPLASGGQIYVTHYLNVKTPQSKILATSSAFHRKMLAKPFSHIEYLADFEKGLEEPLWRDAIQAIDAAVIVFGHNHMQTHGYCGETLVLNPGSCGQPLDFDNRAPYTILCEESGKLEVVERRVAYDIDAAIHAAQKSTLCMEGQIWCALCIIALKTGKDYFGFLFEIANEIAARKGENRQFYTDETWEEAYQLFLIKYPEASPGGQAF